MTDNAKKVSELPTASNVATTDRVLVLRDPSGNASVRTVTFSTLGANLVISNSAPLASDSSGIKGTVAYDSNYFYVCVDTDNWTRVPLDTSSW